MGRGGGGEEGRWSGERRGEGGSRGGGGREAGGVDAYPATGASGQGGLLLHTHAQTHINLNVAI